MPCGPLSFICDAAGGAVSSTASAGFDAIAQSFGEAAKTLSGAMWNAIDRTTAIDLHAGWLKSDLAMTIAIGGVVIAALFALQLVKAAMTRDGSALRRALIGSAIGAMAATVAVTITDALLALADVMANGVMETAGVQNASQLGQKVTPVVLLSALTGTTPALVIALAGALMIASLLVWAVFIVRKALIIVAVVFAPIAFAGGTADATRGWVRKWIEFVLTMVFSKLVIVITFVVASSMVTEPGDGIGGLSDLVTGILLLFLAGFSPWMVFKLVHYIGGDVAAAHHSSMVGDSRIAFGAMSTRARGSAQKVFGSGGTPEAATRATRPSTTTPAAATAAPAAAPILGIGAAKRGAGNLAKLGGQTISQSSLNPEAAGSPRRGGSHRAGRGGGAT